jgi:hypothetical protein
MIKEKKVIKLLIGNLTKRLETQKDNQYDWTLFVRTAPGEKHIKEHA